MSGRVARDGQPDAEHRADLAGGRLPGERSRCSRRSAGRRAPGRSPGREAARRAVALLAGEPKEGLSPFRFARAGSGPPPRRLASSGRDRARPAPHHDPPAGRHVRLRAPRRPGGRRVDRSGPVRAPGARRRGGRARRHDRRAAREARHPDRGARGLAAARAGRAGAVDGRRVLLDAGTGALARAAAEGAAPHRALGRAHRGAAGRGAPHREPARAAARPAARGRRRPVRAAAARVARARDDRAARAAPGAPHRRARRPGGRAHGRAGGRRGGGRPRWRAPAARRHRLRQDRGLPAGRGGRARARRGRDRARARDRAHAADRRALPGALRRHGRAAALGARGGRALRRVAPAADGRGADRGRPALGGVRARARPGPDRRRRGARLLLQARGRSALRRPTRGRRSRTPGVRPVALRAQRRGGEHSDIAQRNGPDPGPGGGQCDAASGDVARAPAPDAFRARGQPAAAAGAGARHARRAAPAAPRHAARADRGAQGDPAPQPARVVELPHLPDVREGVGVPAVRRRARAAPGRGRGRVPPLRSPGARPVAL